MSNSSIWPIDRTLSGATTLGQSGPGSNDNEGVLCILQSSSITGVSQSDCLMSGHLLRGSYLSAEMLAVYSTAPTNWVRTYLNQALWPWRWKGWRHLLYAHGINYNNNALQSWIANHLSTIEYLCSKYSAKKIVQQSKEDTATPEVQIIIRILTIKRSFL